MASELYHVRAELKRQLLLGKDDELKGPGIVTIHDFGEDYHSSLKDLDQQLDNPLRTYTDDIWRNPRLFSWLNDDTSSLLLVKGTFDSTARVAVFGAELADHIVQQEPLAYVACTPAILNSFSLPFRFDTAQVLRHLAIQALLNLERRISAEFLIDTLDKFAGS
ncbi:hypothetical protein N0V84_000878 [Fusarium piperis]|uniref:Uncharacterized protein n=1 Tax=Fusarium piperis TaxID=1435070 RepID=A0A9W9BUE8_9HYPO|nr:hypothetical protein N0V84_000878 [Fusarium piperis]